MIDDATGRRLARFYPGATTVGHLDLLGRWLRKHGRPVALYTDRDSIYRVEGTRAPHTPRQTQLSRALAEMNMDPILADSPPAQGRVERLFGRLQDRWVKQLRRARRPLRRRALPLATLLANAAPVPLGRLVVPEPPALDSRATAAGPIC